MFRKRFTSLCIVFAIVLMLPHVTFAHRLTPSFEGSGGKYIADVGYDQLNPVVGQPILFDFGLRDAISTTTRIDFDEVWVRMYQNNKVVLSASIAQPSFGRAALYMVPVYPMPLTIDVRYERGTTTLEVSKFTLQVYHSKYYWAILGIIIVGFLLVGVLEYLPRLFRWRRLRK